MPTALPDTLRLGPLVLPMAPLLVLLGAYLFFTLGTRRAERFGLDAAWTEKAVTAMLVGGILGSKLVDFARSPESYLASPRLLISIPGGPLAAIGALAGIALGLWLATRPHTSRLPALADSLAAPSLFAIALAGLGLADGRAFPLALLFGAAGYTVLALDSQRDFSGQGFFSAVVFGAAAFIAGDLFRPVTGGVAGASTGQIIAATTAVAVWGWSRYLTLTKYSKNGTVADIATSNSSDPALTKGKEGEE
ncbi:MAG: prolipoprotein diacylglyceryl transferase family protein [Thermaerobacterales bacterium]